ncbi:ferritin-like domain-containing protein [Nocardioides sp. IC4_145]|uniref:ferritin-like domain-containing protein n=1 Tax=Nocardioides sp. IC4_145 TaxID=2714037 RepID=UPI00140BA83D|nr:ferritin-like domain-containing protein [Nocardioides sp. IC4_145]NHC22747.1 ferritin-like domain-containing protein [Nocardioides sp. IC4_145]
MTTLDALQATLAAEHAALHVVGALGAQTSESGSPGLYAALQDAYVQHRAQRDRLERELRDRGAEPVAAEPAYELPDRLAAVPAVERRARELETDCAAAYASLVGHTADDLRRWAVEVLVRTAVRGLAFRGTPEMFPGVGEHADRW